MRLNKILFFLCLFGFIVNINADHIRWHGNYEKALLVAKKQNKPLMVFLRKKDCADCRKMLEVSFLNQSYVKKLNDKYIAVIATYEGMSNYPIEMFYTLDFPTLFFVSSNDESFLIDPISGFVTPDDLNSSIELLHNLN